ncbi:MAG: SNF2-related protein [Acidobacteriota bacterium]
MDSLFQAVREACSTATWSRGVEFTRRDAVLALSAEDGEAMFQVLPAGRGSASTVTLYADDDDWACDCGGSEDPCVHVAAATIAWRRARRERTPLPDAGSRLGRIEYRLAVQAAGLSIARWLVRGETSHPLDGPLARRAAKDADLAAVVSDADRRVERALGREVSGQVPDRLLPDLFRALARCASVWLDGVPVRVDARPLTPRVCVTDQGDGFLLFLAPPPDVTRQIGDHVALCGEVLRLVVPPPLTARERDDLTRGLAIDAERVGELVADRLPGLRRRLPVDVQTTRLPGRTALPPRLVAEVGEEDRSLTVRAGLVYGRPPVARVEDGALVHVDGAIPVRDVAAEKRLLRELRADLGIVPGEVARFDGEAAVAMATRLAAWPGEVRGAVLPHFALASPLAPRSDPAAAGWAIDFVCENEAGRAAPRRAAGAAVLRAWTAGEPLVRLEAGGYAPLPADWLARFGAQLADLLAARDAHHGELPAAAQIDLLRFCEAAELPVPDGLDRDRLHALLAGADRLPAAVLPADFRGVLRDYQRIGVDWLARLAAAGFGALLADDMGLGKTVQALCVLRPPALVVAPTSVLFNWSDEIRRFRPGLSVCLYHGAGRQLDADADVTLTTYALLRLDVERLTARRWGSVVVDEAQNIKNPDSQVARAACCLDAPVKIALTGTPVENRLEELWSLFRLLNPGLLGTRDDFRRRSASPIAAGDAAALDRLRRRLGPFVLRRRKKEVAPELPARTDVVRHCELNETERRVYEAVAASARQDVVARLEAGGSVVEALELLLRLRQACCHAGLVPGQEAASSAKLDLLLDCLAEVVADGHKALVFSQWTSLLDRVEPYLAAAAIPFIRLDGSTKDRGGVVARFQASGGPPVMLISLRAGGTGLNLTAADHVFLLDPWWNPAVEEQAADRAHRIGQDRPVLVTRLVARETVEERILLLQESKRALAASLEGGAAPVSLTRDDLLALLA